MGFKKERRPILPSSSGDRRYSTVGDASATLDWPTDGDGSTLVFTAPITTTRTVTLGTVGVPDGMIWRVVRNAAVTGASDINVQSGLASLLIPGDYCELIFNKAGGVWVLIGFGQLIVP